MKIAFTGHRKTLWRNPLVEEVKFVYTLSAYLSTIKEPYTFIVGGCPGIDHAAAQYAMANHIPFDLYVPFPLIIHAKTKGWTKEDQYALLEQHKRCQSKKIFSETFNVAAYYERDKAMVTDGDLLLSWYFLPNSGSGKTVKYAESISKPFIHLRTWKG